jgi:hypothetical protein
LGVRYFSRKRGTSLNKLFDWLRHKPKGVDETIGLIFGFVAAHIVWSFSMLAVLGAFKLLPPPDKYNIPDLDEMVRSTSDMEVILLVVKTSLVEEFTFRAAPLFAGWGIARFVSWVGSIPLTGVANWTLILISLGSSVLFGYIHGGWFTVPIQGVGGMVFCAAYLKFGGLEGRFLPSLLGSWAVHASFNLALFLPVLLWSPHV